MTARYNIYFNAKESFKAGQQRIDDGITDNFTYLLPIYKYGDPDAANMAVAEMELAIQKSSKLIAMHSITRKPKRKSNTSERYQQFASKKEYNNWVDDSYLLMGKASYHMHDFHRAEENFNYLLRSFTASPLRHEAYLSLAKNYIESGELSKVPDLLKRVERDGAVPQKLKHDINLTYAWYHIKSKQDSAAIPYLERALQYPMARRLKIRTNYILAQLYAQQGESKKAAALYRKVVKMRPEVDMAFNARISALELAQGDTVSANQVLSKLLKDPNNDKFRDRIYFAKGVLALRGAEREKAAGYFRQSAAFSTDNEKQRAISCLNAARIYYDDEQYELASAYYDSTLAVAQPTLPDYSEVINRSASLKRLVGNLQTVTREDSLQRLAQMSEAERNNLIAAIISQQQRKEQEALAAERMETNDQNYFRAQQYRQQIRTADNANLWYFYNPSTAGIGKTEFQRIWGKRKLEDNWRRKNKLTQGSEPEQLIADQQTLPTGEQQQPKISDPKTRGYYLQDIPLSDSMMVASHERIKNSLFEAGRLFRNPIGNLPRSAEVLEELLRRYPGTVFELPAYTELHQLATESGNGEKEAEYRTIITGKYPQSQYARYLLNPDFFTEQAQQRTAAEQKYDAAIEAYQKGNFAESARLANEVIAQSPDSSLTIKARFVELTSTGKSKGNEGFTAALEQYIARYPNASTVGLAIKIRDLLKENSLADYQQLIASGYINAEIVNEELKNDRNSNDEFGGKFSYDEDMFHYYVVAFPKQSNVPVNRLIFDIANYNIDYYTTTDFDVESVSLNPKTQMVVVRSMPNKEEGLIYFKSIIRKRQVFKSLEGIDYNNFSASSANYRSIIAEKELTDYLKFFVKNYSPYIGTEYPKDNIAAPSELIAKAREAEQPVEKGTFVMVQQTASNKNQYTLELDKPHLFIIIVNDSTQSMAPVAAQFINYNSTNFPGKYPVNTTTINGKPALTVSGLSGEQQGMEYFRGAVANRTLYTDIDNLDYTNFLITENNVEVLKQKKETREYIAFFRENYLKLAAKPEPAANTAESTADYVGPYSKKLSNENNFVLVFPTENVAAQSLKEQFQRFNSENFGSPKLVVELEQLDAFRSILVVHGLGEHAAAIAYFKRASGYSSLFADLKGINYRFFTISNENYEIFKRDKNIQLYMDYFNRVKW